MRVARHCAGQPAFLSRALSMAQSATADTMTSYLIYQRYQHLLCEWFRVGPRLIQEIIYAYLRIYGVLLWIGLYRVKYRPQL